jgi:hypothetical protein
MHRQPRVRTLAFFILFSFAPISLFADEISFRCIVKNEYHLTKDGQLIKPDKYYYCNSSFVVERSSGKILGGVFNNEGDYQKNVIGGGSFKVFSFAEKRGVAESVAIKTHQEGQKKPFIGIDYLQTVVTGTVIKPLAKQPLSP